MLPEILHWACAQRSLSELSDWPVYKNIEITDKFDQDQYAADAAVFTAMAAFKVANAIESLSCHSNIREMRRSIRLSLLRGISSGPGEC